jgi:hypothetical protein
MGSIPTTREGRREGEREESRRRREEKEKERKEREGEKTTTTSTTLREYKNEENIIPTPIRRNKICP